jgi:HlyD family secretion protein/adhesin transport system membrane fusion protein
VARTPGEAVPQGFEQVVQHLEGGIVREIRAREGQIVDKRDVVLVLDGGGSQEDLARAASKQVSLDLQEERLRAFSEGREPDFSAYKASHPDLVRDQTMFFNGMIDARKQERKVIDEQILQKQRSISTLASDLETARENYQITKDLYDRRAELNRKGYASDIQFLETKQSLNNVGGEMRQLQNRISVAKSEITEFQNRLKSLNATYHDDANERLDQLMGEKAQNAEVISKMRDRVSRLEVRAPARGIVKGLAVNTVGAVVQPGQVVMEIVPVDEQIVVQVKISPQHIGHVKTGQKVQVKFSSFDFSRYGIVSGELDQISAATFTGDKGERYYQGRIRLDHNYVGHDPRNVVVPGMTVMAEIITGRKTVLDYLLKPIHIAMKTAFTER